MAGKDQRIPTEEAAPQVQANSSAEHRTAVGGAVGSAKHMVAVLGILGPGVVLEEDSLASGVAAWYKVVVGVGAGRMAVSVGRGIAAGTAVETWKTRAKLRSRVVP